MNKERMPADNKRFGEIGGEVITRISLSPLTGSDSPNCVQLSPNFAKPPGRYLQAAEVRLVHADFFLM
jgi:hypothetical protein